MTHIPLGPWESWTIHPSNLSAPEPDGLHRMHLRRVVGTAEAEHESASLKLTKDGYMVGFSNSRGFWMLGTSDLTTAKARADTMLGWAGCEVSE